jgi:uncharacterized repeat protein (TIGR03803 family)
MVVKQSAARSIVTMAIAVTLFTQTLAWAVTGVKVIHNFTGGSDGNGPIWYGNLIIDSKGNLYGTASGGGNSDCGGFGCGMVFELTPSKRGWQKKVLYEFAGVNDGAYPWAGLTFDKAGNLYGTTVGGGSSGCGTVFQLSPASGGGWTESVLQSLSGTAGCEPVASVILDKAGNVYGTTARGGMHGSGTVFELTNTGGVWIETVLYNFGADGNDGQSSYAALAMDKAGNLYGTTLYGGAYSFGTVFELSQAGGVWTEKVIYDFKYYNGNHDGAYPDAGVSFDRAGNLYGTTNYGGSGTACPPGSCGAVYRLKRSGSGWTESVLYSFRSGKDGSFPTAGVTLIGSKLYGTTSFGGGGSCQLNGLTGCGTIFSLELLGGKWVERVFRLKGSNGALPQAGIVSNKKGILFGTTLYGGSGPCTDNLPGCGVVFALTP